MRSLGIAMSLATVVMVAADEPDRTTTLATVLQRAGERVERYFARAQSIVCLEMVRLQPLTAGWSSDGIGRTVESELRLSWAPAPDGAPPPDAHMLRQVLRVNGHKPRVNDWNNCTAPEQQTQEPQPLSLLLRSQRADYTFELAGQARVDRRPAILLDYRVITDVTVKTRLVEGREDCVSFDLEGGVRGRIWIDAETFDVLRLDQRLSGMVEIPLPKKLLRRSSGPTSWTMERWDTEIRFKQVPFTNPDETLVLPSSMSSIRVTRGSATPRLRTTTDYVSYQRFLTSGRIIPHTPS